MSNPEHTKIVSREQWAEARKALLQKEKTLTRQRDQLNAERREPPRVRLEKVYQFDTPDGRKTLADLYQRLGRQQDAISDYERALELATLVPEQQFIRRRMQELSSENVRS
ncbi:MAG: DUF899 family protein [Gammaproteobacteria bacterium]